MLVNQRPSFPNNSALADALRVTLSGGFLVVADASTDELGTTETQLFATDTTGAVLPIDAEGVRHMTASAAITQYATVYAAAGGKIAPTGTLIRGMAMEAASGNGSVIKVSTARASITGTLARANLVQDDAAIIGAPLNSWGVTGTGAGLGATAGTPSGAFGLTVGTLGTGSPKIVGEAASGNVKTDKMRRQFILPPEYVAGQPVTLRMAAKEAVGHATVGTTLGVTAYKGDKAAGVGANICATSPIAVTATIGNKDFTITPTTLNPGDIIDVEVTGITTDTGGTVGTILEIYSTDLRVSVKG